MLYLFTRKKKRQLKRPNKDRQQQRKVKIDCEKKRVHRFGQTIEASSRLFKLITVVVAELLNDGRL